MSGTKNGPVDLTAHENKSVSNGTLNGSSNEEDAAMTNMESHKPTERRIDDNKGGSNGSEGALMSKSVSNKDGVVQGGDVGGDVVMEGVTPSLKPVKNVGFSDGAHQSYADDLARIMIKIEDTQHLIKNSTGVELVIAKEDMLKLQYSLSEKKKMTTSSENVPYDGLKDTQEDMAIDACDLAGKSSKEQLDKSTAINAISSICVASLENLVTPVWKYSQHQPRCSSIAALKNTIWKKIFAFKNVEAIVSQSNSIKFQDLWSKSNAVAYSPDTPVSAIMDFISVLDKKKEDQTKSAEARYVFHNTFVALSRTSSEVFGGDWKRSGELHPFPPAFLWTAAIKVLGCSFNLKVQIKLTAKGILNRDSKDLQVGGKKLT